MKKTIPLVALLCFFAHTIFAQENEQEEFTRDIGFNTTFILQGIFQSNQTPFSLMYKKYTSPTKAIRLGASFSFNFTKSDVNENFLNNFTDNSHASLTLTIGKEFQKELSKNWVWYYGGDILPSVWFSNYDYYSSNTKYSEDRYYNIGLGARPFLGIRYNLTRRLYLAAEASALLSYNFLRFKSESLELDEVTRDIKQSNAGLKLSPASGIFLFYRF